MLRARPGGAGLPIMLPLSLFTPLPTEAGDAIRACRADARRGKRPVAADALRQRAHQAYERALAANGEDRRSRDGLARLDKSGSGASATGEMRRR
jgi:hypothetical protein